MPNNIFVVLRIIVATLFIITGAEKLISPYQNFLAVVQSYELLNKPLEEFVAKIFPWLEFFLGVFLLLGLWLKIALRLLLVLIASFIGTVGQAMIRHLPIHDCGCFGDLISFPLWVTLVLDCVLWIAVWTFLRRIQQTSQFSLDNYYYRG